MKIICRYIRLNRFLAVIFFLCIAPNYGDASLSYTIEGYDNSFAVVTISGTVKNNGGVPFDSVEVQAINPSTNSIVVSTLTNSSGSYSLSVNHGIYDIKAIPPAGSGFTPAILLGQAITAPTIIDFVLVPAGACALSGKITDRDGNPIVNQLVQLSSFINLFDTTDAFGDYSFIASPGTYTLSTPPSPGIVHPYLPEMFYLWTNGLVLSGNTILNIQLPNILADITVLDPADIPVPGTTIRTELAMTSTTFSAGSVVFYGNFDPYGVTDSAGRALVWMFPTTTTIKISPPAASGFAPMSLDTASVQIDTVFTVHLIPAITLSGKMTDRDGNPIVNQLVQLSRFTNVIDTTDFLGNYSFSVSPGTYTFSTPASPGIVHPHLPQMFYLWANDLVLSADTAIDIQLPNVLADITVLDPANIPVPGTTIRTELAMTSTTFSAGSVLFHGNFDPYGITDSAGQALVWMFPTTTTIKISPPMASGFAPMSLDTVSIHADTVITVHLIHAITLSGTITDRDAQPVVNQLVQLSNFINVIDTTDTLGHYSFSVSPGTYIFSTPSSPGIIHPHLPEMFYLWVNNLTLTDSTILNIRLPNISLAVTVLDLANNPVPGTTIRTELAMTTTTFSAESVLVHGNFDPHGTTDSAGLALVWMFPTITNIKISPPAASGFAPIMVDSVTIVSDKSMVVHLESLLDVRPGTPVPVQFTLLQNYPNPFNPTTTIKYALPVSGFVTLTVVDIMGREAAVLVNENKEGGRWYSVTCDMHNFSAGVYFYHLRVGEFRETRKFVLLK